LVRWVIAGVRTAVPYLAGRAAAVAFDEVTNFKRGDPCYWGRESGFGQEGCREKNTKEKGKEV